MSTIWWFTPCLSEDPSLERLGGHCRFTIGDEVSPARPGAHEIASSDFPAARLELTLENFSLDCFCWVDCHSLQPYMFVSQDLRDAMALGPGDVKYLPVDASLSAPLPRSKNYMIMHVPAVETVADPDQSVYHGTARTSEEPILIERIAIRDDADPKHDIFRDSFFSRYIFCTDELAVSVLQRQCSGIRFADPWYLNDLMRFRSLRGIEQEIWDDEDDVSSAPSKNGGATEADRVTDNRPLAGTNGIYADYGDCIRGVQFAAAPIPIGSLGMTTAKRANLMKLANGSLRSQADEKITAARLLKALDRSRERDAVRSAMAKLQLDPKQAADILAARAYVWTNKFGSWNFADVPASGPGLEPVSASIMQVELARPGTLYFALQGDWRSTVYIRMAAEEGLSDATSVESWAAAQVPAALRSTRTSARAALNL